MKLRQLQPGDTVGLISPSSYCDISSERVAKMEEELHKLGLRIKYSQNVDKHRDYLAGSDEERLHDLHQMFQDPEVKMILCLKGGYGASRIVDRIDYELIRNNSKLLVGFSDITVLLNAMYQKTGLISAHGLVGIFVGHPNLDEKSNQDWVEFLFQKQKGRVLKNFKKQAVTITGGVAEGVVVGGNLSLIATLVGSEYDIDFTDKIVLIEEVSEAPYRIDRMMSQLRLAKKLQTAKGFIIGHFTDCASKSGETEYMDVLTEYLKDLGVPVLAEFETGHEFPFHNIWIGSKVRLDADKQEIEIIEEIYQ